MRVLLQRVKSASVEVEDVTVGRIDRGLVALVGIGPDDSFAVAERLATKAVNMRIFEDSAGRMNLSLRDLAGDLAPDAGMLVVSQFTLYADVRKGRRPSFTDAATPDLARDIVDHFAHVVRTEGVRVATGEFAAHMVVSLENDGPVTIWIDSADLGLD